MPVPYFLSLEEYVNEQSRNTMFVLVFGSMKEMHVIVGYLAFLFLSELGSRNYLDRAFSCSITMNPRVESSFDR